MATSLDYIQFVCDSISFIPCVRYKKMFGEYMVYSEEKPILLVCDNTCFVKMLPCLDAVLCNAPKGYPYEGAKQYYVLDVEDSTLAETVINLVKENTTLAAKKAKKL